MEVRAHLRYLRIAPRKVRLVINLIRGMAVDNAIDQLTILPKKSSLPILKLLNSAIANAENNFQLDRKTLKVQSIVANEGPKLKRYRPRAFGRAAEILKRSTHVSIILIGEGGKKETKSAKADEAKPDTVATGSVKKPTATPKAKRPVSRPKAKPTDKENQRAGSDTIVQRKGES